MRRLLIAMAAVAAVLSACGGGDSNSSSNDKASGVTTTAPVTLEGKVNDHGTTDIAGSGAQASLDVETDDFYFSPTFVKAAPSAVVTVALHNEGSVVHTFTIEALAIDETLQPDDKKTVTLTLPASGATRFTCRFHGGSGMQGAFFFNQGDAVATAATSPPVSASS